MRLRLIAIGTRMPAWVRSGFDDYARRLHSPLRFELVELPAGRRSVAADATRAVADEGRRMLAALSTREHVVALDEHGSAQSTRELAQWLALRMRDGLDVALLVGGPDGFASTVLARAQQRWSLSQLTLPHAMVRVIVAEQLYRAHSLLNHHPYHRD